MEGHRLVVAALLTSDFWLLLVYSTHFMKTKHQKKLPSPILVERVVPRLCIIYYGLHTNMRYCRPTTPTI